MTQVVLRYADPLTRARLPLPSEPSANLLRSGTGLRLLLPALVPGDLVLPSFAALPGVPYQFQFSLAGVPLPPVPSTHTGQPVTTSCRSGAFTTHLDWFEVHEPVTGAALELHCDLGLTLGPHLLSVSIRPLMIAADPAAPASVRCDPPPPSLSQRLGPETIRGGICSPTAVAMVLGAQQRASAPLERWLEFVERCRDPATGIYGLWPLNILRASDAGSLGAVQTFSSWQDATPLLAAGLPLVASIRYGAGKLEGTPTPATSGHLVVVYGVDEDWVLVNDPAAPTIAEVARRYPREQFERAWFEHRGAGYYLLP